LFLHRLANTPAILNPECRVFLLALSYMFLDTITNIPRITLYRLLLMVQDHFHPTYCSYESTGRQSLKITLSTSHNLAGNIPLFLLIDPLPGFLQNPRLYWCYGRHPRPQMDEKSQIIVKVGNDLLRLQLEQPFSGVKARFLYQLAPGWPLPSSSICASDEKISTEFSNGSLSKYKRFHLQRYLLS
jgi:hypothetical protein